MKVFYPCRPGQWLVKCLLVQKTAECHPSRSPQSTPANGASRVNRLAMKAAWKLFAEKPNEFQGTPEERKSHSNTPCSCTRVSDLCNTGAGTTHETCPCLYMKRCRQQC